MHIIFKIVRPSKPRISQNIISFAFTYIHDILQDMNILDYYAVGIDQVDGQISTIVHESDKELTVLFDEIFIQVTDESIYNECYISCMLYFMNVI